MEALLDRFISVDSPIHCLDLRVKLLATVGFIVGNAAAGWRMAGLCAAAAAIDAVDQRIRAVAGFGALKRSFIALPFMLAGFSVVFATPGREIAQWTPLGLDLRVTDAGVVRFISIMLRTWLSVQMAILLTATTDFPALTHALRHLKVPAVLVSIIAFMYRYLFVLVEEAQRLLRARASRSAVLPGQKGGGGLLWRAKVAGNMGGQLLVRSMARADRVYMAMQARGYRGELLTMTRHTMQRRDWQAAALMLLLLAAVQLVGRV
ncbi:MAG: cobalt ECF transporter T component CbiQ [Ardenticatenales bacterium]|nr:cobalt ECF transporter T component CbiQ [Ardenticatenales bacterium]